MTWSWLLLAAAALLGSVGSGAVRSRRPSGPPPQVLAGSTAAATALPLALDLAAIALHAGAPVDRALALAAPAAPAQADALLRVAGLLRLGAEPEDAWRVCADDPQLGPVAAAARRSAISGARLASAFERLAVQHRADLRVAAQARAHRAGVLAAGPLGLCFLPSFVCLGVAPIVIGIARGVLTG